jgi:two-component system, NtrC family, response regulator AtoC
LGSDPTTIDAEAWRPERKAVQLHLLVIREEGATTHALPRKGKLTVGRTETNDVPIDHVLLSREHAVIHVDESIEIEDLGSKNGTRVGGEALTPHKRLQVYPGQVIEFGGTMALIQATNPHKAARSFATHAHFEATLEEACAEARATGRALAVARVRLPEEVTGRRLLEALEGLLGPRDIVANYAPGEHEIMLRNKDRQDATTILAKLKQALPSIEVGFAAHPEDGLGAQALLDRAGRQAAPKQSEGFVVLDQAMLDLYRIAEKVAQGSISVTLLGETGVGKEVLAEAVHKASPRRDGPYVRINCAALAETLLEGELFGYEKGAFTGANRTKPGLLETAHQGTVFLDELGELPAAIQAKLLRVIEQRQVLRLGALEPRSIDVRFVSATNRDLEQEVVRGAFRRDLYFRLNGVSLRVPPLRERRAEIQPLADRFARAIAIELGRPVPDISPRAMALLIAYDWPGNIRELKNVIERAVLLAPDERIEPEHLPLDRLFLDQGRAPPEPAAIEPIGAEETEHKRILAALEACGGNQTRAARMLGMGRRTLAGRLDRYQIPRPKKS